MIAPPQYALNPKAIMYPTVLILIAALVATPVVYASSAPDAASIDAVVAVVNNDVITQLELDEKMRSTVSQLKKQGTPLPELAVLKKQLLERMVLDTLQLQYAKETGVRIDDAQLELAMSRIVEQNKLAGLSELRVKLQAEGVDYDKFREDMRNEMLYTRLREREIDSKLIISDSEVDTYLANQAKQGDVKEEFKLAHILVVIPEQASAEKIKASRTRIELAYKQLQAGADFAQVAAGVSDAKDALKGGDLGWRGTDRLPPSFADALQKLSAGQTTAIMQSPNGFHILKLLAKRVGSAPVVITQTHARHILIKISEIVPEAEAKKRLLAIKQRIDAGADFAEQAKKYSEDGSAQGGGDLDWLSPGQTVAEFEEAMNKLGVQKVGAVQSQFGWHLIQVLERRDTDVSVQQKRQQARIAIGTFKSDEQFQDWQRQLRDRAFVDYPQ
jgi:peptidyl-prolyl cis-trans isomerase SurA